MKRKHLLTRRQAIVAGLTSATALLLPGCSKPLPPTYGHILRMGDNLTYVAHRALLPGQSLVREYSRADISNFPATGTTDPGKSGSEEYARLQQNAFANWGLSVEGLVDRPGTYSLADLQKLPSQKQITRHTCEEGWTAIAEWTGPRVSSLLQAAGIQTSAQFVNFFGYDGYADCLDLVDVFHPQTILAYGMNGRNLPTQHGAPVRLRLETQIGYKSMKYLQRIVVTDHFDDMGINGSIQNGWAWYNGI